uniref:Cytochrome P450 n=1 Tax=Timema poppense TaxID=170557 RepID=A0A7R9DLK8_TIMPO|nr:unnamed protein product [Timema poppensis]
MNISFQAENHFLHLSENYTWKMGLLDVLLSTSHWLLLPALILGLLYILGTWNYDYFSKQNIPYVKPWPFVGNFGPLILRRISFPDNNLRLYRAYKGHRLTGVFQFTRSRTIIRDIELLKLIAIKDFDHFMNHFTFTNPDLDPLFSGNLLLLKERCYSPHVALERGIGWYTGHRTNCSKSNNKIFGRLGGSSGRNYLDQLLDKLRTTLERHEGYLKSKLQFQQDEVHVRTSFPMWTADDGLLGGTGAEKW